MVALRSQTVLRRHRALIPAAFFALACIVGFSARSAAAAGWCDQAPAPELATLEKLAVRSGWFMVYRVRPGVYAITEPRQAEQVISYLILGSRRAVLFDSGLGIGLMRELVGELTPLPITVLNSHTHFDHVGGNAEFDDVLNENTAFSRKSARGKMTKALSDYARSTLDMDHVCGKLPKSARVPYVTRPWRITRYLRDQERLDLGDRVLEVLFTPGHTPDSICLLDEHNGLLFTGDTFYPGTIYLWAPETNFSAYTRSVAALAALAPRLTLLLPAHDIPVASPGRLVELNDALSQLLVGKLVPVISENGRRLYHFEHISVLLAPEGEQH